MHGGHPAHRNIPVLNYRFLNRQRKNQAAAIKFHTRFGDFNQPVESAATNLPKPSNFPSETIFRGIKIRQRQRDSMPPYKCMYLLKFRHLPRVPRIQTQMKNAASALFRLGAPIFEPIYLRT
ncbi:hypothetical protein [Thalassospira lohafexi]|uniref:hypothetical protein n=1 Tax=Thalassospira lohafexi TaxID=744227 RepID=UPI001054F730|nr:hypothetical protein [Thalassospira lohafexi]